MQAMPSGTIVVTFAHNGSNTVVVAFTSSNLTYSKTHTQHIQIMIAIYESDSIHRCRKMFYSAGAKFIMKSLMLIIVNNVIEQVFSCCCTLLMCSCLLLM